MYVDYIMLYTYNYIQLQTVNLIVFECLFMFMLCKYIYFNREDWKCINSNFPAVMPS